MKYIQGSLKVGLVFTCSESNWYLGYSHTEVKVMWTTPAVWKKKKYCKLFQWFEMLFERKQKHCHVSIFLTNFCFLIGSGDDIHLTESHVLALSPFLYSPSSFCTPVPSSNRDRHFYLTEPNFAICKMRGWNYYKI